MGFDMWGWYLVIIVFSGMTFRVADSYDISFSRGSKRNNHAQKFYILTAFIVLALFSGLRHFGVGIDISTYALNIFHSTDEYGISYTLKNYSRWADIGYVLFSWICAKIFHNFQWFLGINTIVIFGNYFLFFRKYKDRISVAFAMFLVMLLNFSLSFSMMRQSLAASFVIWFYYFYDKKKLLALLFAIIAVSFHQSALIMILLIFFSNIVSKFVSSRNILLFCCFFVVFTVVSFRYFPAIFTNLLGESYFVGYFDRNSGRGSITRLLLFLFPLIVLWLFKPKAATSTESNINSKVLKILVAMTIAFSWIEGINFGISRFNSYNYVFYTLFLAGTVAQSNRKNYKLLCFLVIIWGITAWLFLQVRGNNGGVFPWVPYWVDYIPDWLNDVQELRYLFQ